MLTSLVCHVVVALVVIDICRCNPVSAPRRRESIAFSALSALVRCCIVLDCCEYRIIRVHVSTVVWFFQLYLTCLLFLRTYVCL